MTCKNDSKPVRAKGLCSNCYTQMKYGYTPHPAVKRVLHNTNVKTVFASLSTDQKRAVYEKVLKHRRACRKLDVPTSDQFVREAVIDAANGLLEEI